MCSDDTPNASRHPSHSFVNESHFSGVDNRPPTLTAVLSSGLPLASKYATLAISNCICRALSVLRIESVIHIPGGFCWTKVLVPFEIVRRHAHAVVVGLPISVQIGHGATVGRYAVVEHLAVPALLVEAINANARWLVSATRHDDVAFPTVYIDRRRLTGLLDLGDCVGLEFRRCGLEGESGQPGDKIG